MFVIESQGIIMLRNLFFALPISLGTASLAEAASFDVFAAGTDSLLGEFTAPAGGGPLDAAMFVIDGGTFSVLGTGGLAPSYNAAENSLAGPGGVGFGAIFNAAAYDTTDVNGDPVTCGVGDCVFEFDGIFDPEIPGEWAVQYVPAGDPESSVNITGGYYEIAAVPLPLTAPALAFAMGSLVLLRRRRSGA